MKGLLTGSDLESLEALTQSLIDGTLQPESDYKGFRPDHFYTFWNASPHLQLGYPVAADSRCWLQGARDGGTHGSSA